MRRVAGCVVGVSLVLTGVFAGAAPQGGAAAERATAALRARIVKDRPFSVSPSCVTYVTEETTSAYVVIAVRERHDARCGGDPDTAPVIDRFRVEGPSGRILVLDVVEDEWIEYALYLKARRK